jgi:hypothetical protein
MVERVSFCEDPPQRLADEARFLGFARNDRRALE